MEQNVGGMDRTARLVVGAILVLVGLVLFAGLVSLGEGTLYTVVVPALAVVVGAVLLVTGWIQQCPINRALGIDTLRRS